MAYVLKRQEVLESQALGQALASDNPREAARVILTAAKAGSPDAQAMLGQILLEGRGIAQDARLALTWFTIAADQGHTMALNMVGRCREHGWGCEQDAHAAAEAYRQAAEQGLDWGMYNYANLLATGRGVTRDEYNAFLLYRRAAELGHAKSMNLVGRFYEEGIVITRDTLVALDWYKRSAEAGDFRGQYSYAAVLATGGRLEEAQHWLKEALKTGNLNFFRASRQGLLKSEHETLRMIGLAYFERAAEMGDESDHKAYISAQRTLNHQPLLA
jgi:TPR repeat protein